MGVETASSVRNRSPSPARAALMPSTIVGGVASVESRDNNNDNNDNNLLDVERGSTASTPSFFGMRQMSPGRMKRTWRKRSAAANAASSPGGNLKNSNLPPAPNFKNSNPSGGSFKNSNGSFKNPNVPPRRISASLFKRLPSPGRMGPGSNGADDGDLPALLPTNLAQTTMSFDVDDSFSRNKAPARLPSPVPEAGPQSIAAATGPGVLASREFSRVAGQSRAANLAAGCVRAGDNLLRKTTDGGGGGNDDADRTAERAARAYRAGAGGMLVAARDLSSSSSSSPRGPMNDLLDEKGEYVPSAPPPSSSEVTRADLLEIVARDPDAGALPLAMSSALLRAGNADFRRGRYEEACREYAAAGACRSLRHAGRRREGGGDNDDGNDNDDDRLDFEDAVLNGRTANNAASALSRRGMYEEARSEYARALQIKQGALETLHGRSSDPRDEIKGGKEVDDSDLVSDIASTFHNIGLLRMNCDEPRKAEKAYKQSLSLRVKKFGLDDLGVSSTLRALGDLYHELGQHDDAFRSYKESLRIWKSHGSQGRSDFRTADHYYNIGLVFYSKGPLAKARTSAAECLRIRRLLCKGKDTKDGKHLLPVAAALYLLGSIASSSGNYDEALSLLEEALDIRREALDSSDHLLVLNVQLAMGTVLRRQNDAEGAMARFSAALRGRTRRLGKDHPAVAEVLQAVGEAYLSTRRHREARRTLEEALRIRRSARSSPKRGRRASEVAETLDCLGAVLFRSGDAAGAAALAEEALDVLRIGVAGRADSLLAGRVLKNAGDYYQDAEAYDVAVEAYGESLRVLTAWHGREHVFLSEVLNEIGVTRFKNGEYMIAKQSFTEALRLMRLTHNEANKSAIFPTLNHLGHALYKNNELKLAAETYIESFNIQVSIVTGDANDGLREFSTKFNLVNDRLDAAERDEEDLAGLSESLGGIAGILRYIALVLQDQGDFEAALSANKLSLSVRLCQPIKEHPAIALMAETIAMLEYKRNDPASAMGYFNQALQAKKSFQGESTIDVARTANNLANMHFSLGNLDEAMELYQEALEIKRHCLGDDSDEVANTLNNIAHVMVDAGREQEALGAYHNVVKIRQDLHGKSHLSVAATLASMGDVYIKLGELEIAMTYFEQCIRIRKLHRDPCDERVLENLGSIYGKLGQWHKAESTFKEIVELKRAAHGNECMDVARTLDLLAVSYIEQDRHVESIEHLREALRIRKACLDDDDDEILASLNKLAFVYKSLGMNERMVEMREEFEALQERRRRGS